MLFKRFSVFLFLVNSCLNLDILSMFDQTGFKIKDYRLELVSYNSTIMKYAKATTFKYNRTTPAANISLFFLIDVQDKLQNVLQAYKFASNEYRIFPALRFQVSLSSAFKANALGMQNIKKCGNIQTFYFVKNVDYHTCNLIPDERKLPPLIPDGKYKFNMNVMYFDVKAFEFNWYVEMYRPIAIPDN